MLGCKDKRIKKSELVANDFDIIMCQMKIIIKTMKLKTNQIKMMMSWKKIPINQIKIIKKLPSDGSWAILSLEPKSSGSSCKIITF